MQFCRFGNASNAGNMDSRSFKKCLTDSKIAHPKYLNTTSIDLIFTKNKRKGERTISYTQFMDALQDVGVKRYAKTFKEQGAQACLEKVQALIGGGSGPGLSGKITKPDDDIKFFDPATYTGAHKNGGPSTKDNRITLSSLADRSASDARGRNMH